MQNFYHWNQIEEFLSTSDNHTKGELFEQLTESYLNWNPKYKTLLNKVWRMKDVPFSVLGKLNIPSQDQGIDLIAETFEGKYWAIQCKYHRDNTKRISHREISTFLALSNAVANHIDFCLIATTADDYAKLYKGQNNIGFLLTDTWTQLPESFFNQFNKKEPVKITPRSPRPHQKEAIQEAKKHFKNESRGKLIFPCGAGKSLTGYWISKELKANSIVVAVPSLALVKQTLEDYCQESFAEGNPIAPFCICSDEGIGKNDDVAVFTQDMGIACTTDKAKIIHFLKSDTTRNKVIFTTYQSGRVLGEAMKELDFQFDVGIMDESHKTVGASDKLFSFLLFDENVAIKKRIFMTATERRYKGSSDNVLSMDDVSVYGETFNQLSFKQAISQEILSDYKILTLVITQSEIKEYLKQNDFVTALGLRWEKDIDFRTLSSLVALRKAMEKYPIKHAVTFHSSIKRAKLFEQLQPAFDEAYSSFQQVQAFHVTGSIPTGQRSKIISEFSQSDKSIITNAKCLTEGVDVPNIDCVLFADPRKSSIDIVQAVGRALRRSKGKEFGYILLPVYAESNDKESIIESEDFQAILQTLRALAANDERIIEYFREKQKTDAQKTKDTLIQFDFDNIIGQSIQTDDLLESIELQAWSRLAKLSWRPFEEAREFVRNLNIPGKNEWALKYKNREIPYDIPATPNYIYSNDWVSWGDWFGNGNIQPQMINFLTYNEAKQIVHKLNISNVKQWNDYKKLYKLPEGIPKTPEEVYKESGWTNYFDWLGNKQKLFIDFKKARVFAQKLKFKSRAEWTRFTKSDDFPDNIPTVPSKTYKNSGWVDWSDFLDIQIEETKNKKFMNYSEAQKIMQKMKIKSSSEYKNFKLDLKLPALPEKVYKNQGWVSWYEFLGTTNNDYQGLTYDQIKDEIKARKISNQKQYRTLSRKIGLPYHPDRTFKNKGWKGWADFLGKEENE
jgi:superfamily II DNA or RNA helicase